MADPWDKIAHFIQSWNGDEKETLPLTVEELRYLAQQRIELINLQREADRSRKKQD